MNNLSKKHAPCGTPLRRVVGALVIWEMRMKAVLSVMKFERMPVKEECMLRRSWGMYVVC